MTDNEIIKALECCSIDDHIGVCKECPFTDVCDEDEQALQKHALDLINRQKAEIERLQKDLTKCKLGKETLYQAADEIKFVAIKEFAERLRKKCHNYYPSIDSYCISRYAVEIADIDNLVKEMTEVD